ncbi:MAG: hypothetical protein ABEL76_10495 [Bradymonadaceae bacterium]
MQRLRPLAAVAILTATILAAACNTRSADGASGWEPNAAEPVECGGKTCGSDEYCYKSGGCGARRPGPDVECGIDYECIDVPDSCDPKNQCSCTKTPRQCIDFPAEEKCKNPRTIKCIAE